MPDGSANHRAGRNEHGGKCLAAGEHLRELSHGLICADRTPRELVSGREHELRRWPVFFSITSFRSTLTDTNATAAQASDRGGGTRSALHDDFGDFQLPRGSGMLFEIPTGHAKILYNPPFVVRGSVAGKDRPFQRSWLAPCSSIASSKPAPASNHSPTPKIRGKSNNHRGANWLDVLTPTPSRCSLLGRWGLPQVWLMF